MTRSLFLAAALMSAGVANATPTAFSSATDYSADLSDSTALDGAMFLTATMSFADAMRKLSTLTLPDMQKVPLPSQTRIEPREVVPAWRADKEVASSTATVWVPNLD